MKTHLISYGNEKYANSRQRLHQEAITFGLFDSIKIYDPTMLTHAFKIKFDKILKMPRGGGYWIWKLDIILQELENMKENDILIYLDAGYTLNTGGKERYKDYINLLQNSEHNFIGFQNKFIEASWTTKQLFNAFGISDLDIGSTQLVGGCMIYKKNPRLIEMLQEIIHVLENNPLLITDHYNNNQETYFIDNRHDQSIFSIVRKKYGGIILRNEVDLSKNVSILPFWATRISD